MWREHVTGVLLLLSLGQRSFYVLIVYSEKGKTNVGTEPFSFCFSMYSMGRWHFRLARKQTLWHVQWRHYVAHFLPTRGCTASPFVQPRPGHSVNRINSVRYFDFFRNSVNEKQKPKLYMGNCKPSVRFSVYSVLPKKPNSI
jgi:hypothetical protein